MWRLICSGEAATPETVLRLSSGRVGIVLMDGQKANGSHLVAYSVSGLVAGMIAITRAVKRMAATAATQRREMSHPSRKTVPSSQPSRRF
jgi:ammonia channel protein AmtB